MLEASFDIRNREASISGAYQYDSAQRLRMRGIPSPDELMEMDELLSGETVMVEAHFSRATDAQAEPRKATYDPAEDAWMVDVPNQYMLIAQAVDVHVYVSYGQDETHKRAKTMYHGVYTPIGRPAPNGDVTQDQLSAWDILVEEINLAIAGANEATSKANAAAATANEAAERAETAAEGANEAAQRAEDAAADALEAAERANAEAESLGSMTAEATTLEPGSEATATMTKDDDGNRTLTLGIPQGDKGDKGDKGDTGPAGVTFRLKDRILYIDTDKEV